MLKKAEMNNLKMLARGLAAQFGSDCEVVIHEISEQSANHSIVAIENGQVSGRKLGDGPSQVVLEQLAAHAVPEDHLSYLTRTPDGKILKSSTIYMKDSSGAVGAIFSINYDVSRLSIIAGAVNELIAPAERDEQEPQRITQNVSDLLDDLIEQSVRLVGKPVALMNKSDKVQAIQFLSKNGALLITKSGDKIARYFGISKYTLYSYLDMKSGAERQE
ncbi:MAG: helix-turn-helix transcriptional regulator [Oscillospiraceae bacterium]|nr:helix-turn-helix transcriptional regulator [Oscillospiraceae bacterium]